MAIKRLTPTIKKLGYLRLWRDDLAEIITLIQNLENIEITLEANDCELDDLEADFPKFGPRVRYMTFKVSRKPPDSSEPANVMTISFAKGGAKLEATNPDLETRAVMASIEEYVAKKRRIPGWFPHVVGGSRWAITWAILSILSAFWCIIASNAFYNAATGTNVKGGYDITWPGAISGTVVALSIIIMSLIGSGLSRNLLYTGTQSQSPTFWQKNRAGIIIAVLIAAIFYLLGAVTPHF